MDFIKITEQDSNHNDLEKKSVKDLVECMHKEDNNALDAVAQNTENENDNDGEKDENADQYDIMSQ